VTVGREGRLVLLFVGHSILHPFSFRAIVVRNLTQAKAGYLFRAV
jgi:hypothetical protein